MVVGRIGKRGGGYRRRRGANKGRKGNRRSRPRAMTKSQTASIRETIEFTELLPNTPYAGSFDLAQFARASTLAANFKFYKAAYVEFAYEPLYNFYREDPTVPQPTVPYYYSVMNRTQSARSLTLADIQATGAKPIKFTSKITKKYRPNWCSPGLLTGAPISGSPAGLQAGLYINGLKAEYGWLMCPEVVQLNNTGELTSPLLPNNPALNGMTVANAIPINTNQVVYNGHDMILEQDTAVTGATVAKVTATVHWLFKEPASHTGVSAQRLTPKPTDLP